MDKLREQSLIDKSAGIDIPVIEKEEPNKEVKLIIESVVANILWQIEKNHKSSEQQLNALYNQMWSEAYNSSHLKTHAFVDVKISFNHWRYRKFIKIYSYASGPPEGQKQFLRSSVEGDLSAFVANCLNSSGGYKYDPNKYKGVISALRETDPKNLLYLTDDPKKARAAIESGMRAIVVLRPGNHKYTEEDLKDLDRITFFCRFGVRRRTKINRRFLEYILSQLKSILRHILSNIMLYLFNNFLFSSKPKRLNFKKH